MRFYKKEIVELLTEAQTAWGREYVLNCLDEWLNETTTTHASVNELTEVDVNLSDIHAGI